MVSATVLISPLVAAVVLYAVYPLLRSLVAGSNDAPLPPGPPGDPLIGHVRIMPLEYAWKTFGQWGKKFGDIVYVHVFGRPMIIVNSLQAARELMDKRGATYSDRPRLVLFQELMGWDTILAFLRYGDRFRKHRRLMQQHFNPQAALSFRPLQRKEIHSFLGSLLETPDKFPHHIQRLISSTILMVTYGHQVQSDNDPYVELVERATRMAVEPGSPGGTLVDFIPPLRHIPAWMPGAGFKRHALKARQAVREMLDRPYELVRRNRAAGTAQPSFINNLIEEYERQNTVDLTHEDDIKAVGAVLYGAGVETTTSSLMTFILAMVTHPEVVRKAQKEIDMAVGPDRLPDFDDRDSLPYIDCILKELLRWNPPVPLGIPHRAMKPDVYQGKQIPGGSMIIPNLWYMMRDESKYSNPDEFHPDRFLNQSGKNDDSDPMSVVFGFGRRICPGRFFADAGMWLAMACLLAAFDVLPPLDKDGREAVPAVEFTTGTTSQPKDFQCRIVPRTPKYASIVRQYARPSD